jgi:hypothetical protein
MPLGHVKSLVYEVYIKIKTKSKQYHYVSWNRHSASELLYSLGFSPTSGPRGGLAPRMDLGYCFNQIKSQDQQVHKALSHISNTS